MVRKPFCEVQRFRQPALWVILGAVVAAQVGTFGWGLFKQLVLGIPFGDRPMSDAGLALVGVFAIGLSLGLVALLYSSRLVIEVGGDGLRYRFHPFHRRDRSLPLDQVDHWEAVTYRPVLEYGGWGLRMGRRGPAFNVSGNRGVRLFLKDGRELLLGSQRAEELAQALDAARSARP